MLIFASSIAIDLYAEIGSREQMVTEPVTISDSISYNNVKLSFVAQSATILSYGELFRADWYSVEDRGDLMALGSDFSGSFKIFDEGYISAGYSLLTGEITDRTVTYRDRAGDKFWEFPENEELSKSLVNLRLGFGYIVKIEDNLHLVLESGANYTVLYGNNYNQDSSNAGFYCDPHLRYSSIPFKTEIKVGLLYNSNQLSFYQLSPYLAAEYKVNEFFGVFAGLGIGLDTEKSYDTFSSGVSRNYSLGIVLKF